MKFTIEGQPLAKARHRSFIRGRHIVSYDPQEKEKQGVRKNLVAQVKKALNGENKEVCLKTSNLAISSEFNVELSFHTIPPTSFTPSQRNKAFWGIIKPRRNDLDNLCKFLLDAANEVLWPDDRMIDAIKMERKYAPHAKTEVTVKANKTDETSEASEILGLCSPDDFKALIEDVHGIALYRYLNDYDPNTVTQCQREQIAALISKLADNHGKMLSKVAKKCPGYHEKHESKLRFDKISMEGKTLC